MEGARMNWSVGGMVDGFPRRTTRRQMLRAGLATVGTLVAPGPFMRARGRNPLRVGVILPYTGVNAPTGEEVTRGMVLYLEQVGYQAGGRPVQLIYEDETQDPSTAFRKARKLVESDRVDLVTGLVSSAAVYAMRDYIHDSKTVLLVGIAASNGITRERKSPYIFRTSYSNWQLGYAFGAWVAENIGPRIVAIASDYVTGWEKVEAFKASFVSAGGQVLHEIYTPLGSTDFSAYIPGIVQQRPDGIFGFLPGSDAVVFVRQYAQFGLDRSIPLAVAGNMVDEDVLQAVGAAAEGAYSCLHWSIMLDLPANHRFVAAYGNRFNLHPSQAALQGFDTAQLMVEAANAVEGDTADKGRLVEAFRAARFASPRGDFQLDPATHNPVQNMYVRQVRRISGTLHNVVVEDLGRFTDPG